MYMFYRVKNTSLSPTIKYYCSCFKYYIKYAF